MLVLGHRRPGARTARSVEALGEDVRVARHHRVLVRVTQDILDHATHRPNLRDRLDVAVLVDAAACDRLQDLVKVAQDRLGRAVGRRLRVGEGRLSLRRRESAYVHRTHRGVAYNVRSLLDARRAEHVELLQQGDPLSQPEFVGGDGRIERNRTPPLLEPASHLTEHALHLRHGHHVLLERGRVTLAMRVGQHLRLKHRLQRQCHRHQVVHLAVAREQLAKRRVERGKGRAAQDA